MYLIFLIQLLNQGSFLQKIIMHITKVFYFNLGLQKDYHQKKFIVHCYICYV
jgi:hypothetical protein